jgi:hypothetical protein
MEQEPPMPIEFERYVGPFRKVWSMVGRSLVVDAEGRQIARPCADIGSSSWHEEKADWERLAPLLADAVPLYDEATRLAARLEGPDVRRVDGRIVVDEADFSGMLDVLDRIRAGMPPARKTDEEPGEEAPAVYLR